MSLHLTADLNANYDRFVSKVKTSGVVWGLSLEDGWAICPSTDNDRQVMPFWSDEAYAKRHAVKEWSEYVPTPIDLDSFIAHWLQGMNEDEILVGVDFDAQLAGLEIEPNELASELTDGA